jgi:uncharacterized protein (TIGR02145 family)
MPWYDYNRTVDPDSTMFEATTHEHADIAWWEDAIAHEMVITRDEMPDLKSSSNADCGAFIAPGVWREFDCYNLAAIGKTTNDDPFTPSWRLVGGYWQWGRKGPEPNEWYDTNSPNYAHGPTGPDTGSVNSGEISGWDQTEAFDGAWSDIYKTANDPCPEGFRVPTRSQLDGVLNNNNQNTVGSWTSNDTNYSSARLFGEDLMLPAGGLRLSVSGALNYRGSYGRYWSSTESGNSAWRLRLNSGDVDMANSGSRGRGFSVRCVAE